MILDVRELVSEDALEFLRRHQPKDARRHAHDGVVGIAPRGEGIRLLVGRDRDRRHRQTRSFPKAVHHRIQVGRLRGGDDARAVRAQDHRSGRPVHEEVHRTGEHERENHPGLPTDRSADGDEEGSEPRHQHEHFEVTHRSSWLSLARMCERRDLAHPGG